MATPDEEVLLAGGVLSVGTDKLGTMQAVSLRRAGVIEPVTAEEYGRETVKPILMRQVWSVGAVLRDWNAEGLARVFLNVGGDLGKTITWPGTYKPGSDLTDAGFTLVMTPTDSKHPGFTIYQAIPALIDAEMLFSGREELSIACGWLGIRDDLDRIVQVD